MIRLSDEKSFEIVRQAAVLLERENDRLVQRLTEALTENAKLRGESDADLQLRFNALEDELARLRAKIHSPSSSEKRPNDESPVETDKPKAKGHGPRAQTELPIVDEVHKLDDADRVCNACGGELVEWPDQFEDNVVVDVIPRRFVLRRHRRQKYRCACGGCVDTALPPAALCEGAGYSIDFAIEVAASKFLDHAPLERQVRVMKREGLTVDSQTLWDQTQRLATLLEPAYDRIQEYVLSHDVVGADETRWRMMGDAAGEEGGSRWGQLWLVQCSTAAYYTIEDNRSADGGNEILAGYLGTVVCDGYAVYKSLQGFGARFTIANCWVHFRRDLIAEEENWPDHVGKGLALIAKLYAIESSCGDGPEGEAKRCDLRNTKSRAVVSEIQKWMLDTWGSVPPGTGLRDALKYGGGIWSGLTRFLEDPRIPLDNNASERAARGPVLGRKNFYGVRSKRGAKVASIFYTLLESAKLARVEPKGYLRAATMAALRGELIPLPHETIAKQ